MGKLLDRLQPAVKKETKNVFLYTLIGSVVMIIAIFVLHKWFWPDLFPFDYTVFTGAFGGLFVAVLNFFLMSLTVQAVTSEEDDKVAIDIMKKSLAKRKLLHFVWIAIAIAAPFVFWPAGVLPLLFPTAGIKIKGIIEREKYIRQEVEQKQDGC
ncbi:MAG: hypothetical protein IK018_04365 [Lachnospiraceae bacterium]|nr:hypothetical protein [Lachnospiraceae bacterium]MBR5762550.1 hypothetical protein [Lachnospiraceae bacterium]MBR5993015.1 hypothetical protein [Lachnospiraceae bacterium]